MTVLLSQGGFLSYLFLQFHLLPVTAVEYQTGSFM